MKRFTDFRTLLKEADSNNGRIGGYVGLSRMYLKELPEFLKDIKIVGIFDCSDNLLTSLKNSPKIIKGGFYCNNNNLTSLEYGPIEVNGEYRAWFNHLTSLKGSPEMVRSNFDISYNRLTSLEHCPKEVGGSFYCYNNNNEFTIKDVESVCKVVGSIFLS